MKDGNILREPEVKNSVENEVPDMRLSSWKTQIGNIYDEIGQITVDKLRGNEQSILVKVLSNLKAAQDGLKNVKSGRA